MHWGKFLRNAASNWVSYVTTAIVGFLLTPIVVHSLGNTGYGLWTLVLSLTGYFGLLDLGIRSSVGRFVTRYVTLGDHENLNRIVSAAATLLAVCGALALAATTVMLLFFFDAFRVEPQYETAGRIALAIIGVNMACILPLSVCSSVLIGFERFDLLSGTGIVCELTRAALVLLALHSGHGLVALAAVSLFITLLQYGLLAVFAKRLCPGLHVRVSLANRETYRMLFGFSIYRFIWIVANQLIFYSDSVVIGVFLGAASITPFAIAGSLINYGRNIVSLITDPLAPSATRMDAQYDIPGLQRLLIAGTQMSLIFALPLCIGFLFLGRQFITLWMGAGYAASAVFLAALAIAQPVSMSQYASALILAGMAKHRTLAYIALVEGLANLALSIILVHKMGLIGVAWGTVIPNLISAGIAVPCYTLRVLRLSGGAYFLRAILPPVLCAIPIVALAWIFSRIVPTATWLVFLGEVAAIVAVFGAAAYFVCLDANQRTRVIGQARSIFNRETLVNEA